MKRVLQDYPIFFICRKGLLNFPADLYLNNLFDGVLMKIIINNILRIFCFVSLLFILSACSNLSSTHTNDWQAANVQNQVFLADGRLSVKDVQNKGGFAQFHWVNGEEVQTINVNTPLGNTVGQLCRDKNGVLAQNSQGEVFYADSAQDLAYRLTGFFIPLDYLDLWALGKYATDSVHSILPNGVLQQAGWQVQREINPQTKQPKRLTINRDGISIRLIFNNFENIENDNEIQCPQRREL